ncbi:hypothetical protein EJ06DRAFT_27238 [Trichodelitschia bisporula]|uniref:Uncharacterized protein n=1 Tax=Trichodelitschia bisporula TaxID=703511 RepID=A0A6G1IAZ1_9PEZI|nr:hypothetical protein EJ06DRAFT_27238 [Trichodelitschia bisporula]
MRLQWRWDEWTRTKTGQNASADEMRKCGCTALRWYVRWSSVAAMLWCAVECCENIGQVGRIGVSACLRECVYRVLICGCAFAWGGGEEIGGRALELGAWELTLLGPQVNYAVQYTTTKGPSKRVLKLCRSDEFASADAT